MNKKWFGHRKSGQLSKEDIISEQNNHKLVIEPRDDSKVNAASFDISPSCLVMSVRSGSFMRIHSSISRCEKGHTSFDFGSMLVDGAIGALAGYAGGPGAGSKNLTNIGLTNIKRTWNALTNKGVTAAATTLGKGLSYFAKNANYMAKPLVTAITKSSATVVSSSFAKRLAAMERRLEFVY